MSDHYDRYLTTHYSRAHSSDFSRVAQGYAAVYYDVLPEDHSAPILDMGCGMGEFLRFLEARGYTAAEGLELSAEAAETARGRLRSPVHQTPDALAFLAARPGHYRLITMNYVIEHLPKPLVVPTLQAVLGALQPGGSLFVTTDNAARMSGLLARYNDFTHEWIYTELSLNQVMDLAGFERFRLVPPRPPRARSLRSVVGRAALEVWKAGLRLAYFLERPGYYRPRILDSPLAAEACRPQRDQ